MDLGLDLLVPPLSSVVLAAFAGTLAAAGLSWRQGGPAVALWLYGATDLGLLVYVARGCWLSGVGPRAALDLAWAPVFIGWKLALLVWRPGHKKQEWVRTTREGESRSNVS